MIRKTTLFLVTMLAMGSAVVALSESRTPIRSSWYELSSRGLWVRLAFADRTFVLNLWSVSGSVATPSSKTVGGNTLDVQKFVPDILKDTGHVLLATLRVPAWLLSGLLLVYPAVSLIRGPARRWRRGKRGLCRSCGYSLYGLTEPRCPECGQGIPTELLGTIGVPPINREGDRSNREARAGWGDALVATLILMVAGAVAFPFLFEQKTRAQPTGDPGERASGLALSAHRLCTACGIAYPSVIDTLIDGAMRSSPPLDRRRVLAMIGALRDPPRSEDSASACAQCADAILATAAASPPPSDVPVRFNPRLYPSPRIIENPRMPVDWEVDWEAIGLFPFSENAVGPDPDG